MKTTQIDVHMANFWFVQFLTMSHKGRLLTNGNYAQWLKSLQYINDTHKHQRFLLATSVSIADLALINICKKEISAMYICLATRLKCFGVQMGRSC